MLFKFNWILLVVFQSSGVPPALVLLAISGWLHPGFSSELRIVLPLALGGVLLDSALSATGVFVFEQAFIPAWLVVLWFSFALALPQGLGFIGRLPVMIQVLAGGLAGSFSYLAGAALGAVELPYGNAVSGLVLAALWAVLLPLACRGIDVYRKAYRYAQ